MRPEFDKLLSWMNVEPATDEEIEGMELLNPGDLEIYTEKLNQFLSEGYIVFERTGISMMIRSGDCVLGLYSAKGDLVNCSTGLLMHAIWPQLPLKWLIENYVMNPNSNIKVRPGDIFYSNEPLYGGVHSPDQTAIMPIFNGEELIGWALAAAHTPETGAVTPGGMPLKALNRFYEGMRLPPVRIGENYELRDDMMEMISDYMMRASREAMNDVKARATACRRLEMRMSEFAREKGTRFVKGMMRKMIAVGEEAARKRIATINDGIYRAVTLIDHVGTEEALLRCCITAKKKGDIIEFDFTGTSPEHDAGSYLSFPHIAVAHTAIYVLQYIFFDLPIGTAAYSQFRWYFPKGCIFNADEMAPTSRAPSLCALVFNAFYDLFAKMLFDTELRPQIAAATGLGSSMNISGVTQKGVRLSDMLNYPFNTEGQGARYELDGCDSNSFLFTPVSRGYDAEETEEEMPLLHLYQRHRTDSCGFGKYRGGSGVESAYVIHQVPEIAMFSGGRETHIRSTRGLFGGYPGSAKPGIEIHDTDVWEKLANGAKDIPTSTAELLTERTIEGEYDVTHNTREYHLVKNGDVIVHVNSGGAGYGDVLFRDPEKVMDDVRDEIISHWTAQNVYKVVYDPETLVVDVEATEKERQNERENRIERGKPYREFEEEWLVKRAPAQALKHWGSWPDGKQTKRIVRI
ncbi:MAG: hydantoinase B/oxoprolinase family protein [Deltaproteobacteria bacterium]